MNFNSWLLFLLVLITFNIPYAENPKPLEIPITEKILFGDVWATTVDFIRMPKTKDSEPEGVNAAYRHRARIK